MKPTAFYLLTLGVYAGLAEFYGTGGVMFAAVLAGYMVAALVTVRKLEGGE